MQINDRVTHATYGAGTIVEEYTFASGFSYSVRWDNGGPMSSSDCTWESPESLTPLRTNPSTFGNAFYGPYRVKVLGDHTHADPKHVVWVDYVFENGRGGTAPIATIKFDNAAPAQH